MATEEQIARELLDRAKAVGLLMLVDEAGQIALPHSEIFPSLLVALEQIRKLGRQVIDLQAEIHDLKTYVLAEDPGD